METELTYLSTTTIVYTASITIFAAAIFLESVAPRRAQEGQLLWRWSNNFALAIITWYLSALAGTWFVLEVSRWAALHQLGLLNRFRAGPVPAFFILLGTTEFLGYWVHRAMHRYRLLWSLHAIHHADTDVDVSTSYRHHPLEPLISLPIITPVVLLLGAPVEAVLAYRIFDVFASVFSHSNIRLPEPLDRLLRGILLTPDFHRVHHCSEPTFTNSNYGNRVPWFDYLFRTARQRDFAEHEHMQLGLEYLRAANDCRIDRQLIMPVLIAKEHAAPAAEAPAVAKPLG